MLGRSSACPRRHRHGKKAHHKIKDRLSRQPGSLGSAILHYELLARRKGPLRVITSKSPPRTYLKGKFQPRHIATVTQSNLHRLQEHLISLSTSIRAARPMYLTHRLHGPEKRHDNALLSQQELESQRRASMELVQGNRGQGRSPWRPCRRSGPNTS